MGNPWPSSTSLLPHSASHHRAHVVSYLGVTHYSFCLSLFAHSDHFKHPFFWNSGGLRSTSIKQVFQPLPCPDTQTGILFVLYNQANRGALVARFCLDCFSIPAQAGIIPSLQGPAAHHLKFWRNVYLFPANVNTISSLTSWIWNFYSKVHKTLIMTPKPHQAIHNLGLC